MRPHLVVLTSLAACIQQPGGSNRDDGGRSLDALTAEASVGPARDTGPDDPPVDAPRDPHDDAGADGSSDDGPPPRDGSVDTAVPPDFGPPPIATDTHTGHLFWAVDLDNAVVPRGGGEFLDAAGQPYGLIIVNPGGDAPANVAVRDHEAQVAAIEVPPGARVVVPLPRRDVTRTVRAPLAYRVSADAPVSVWQLNPLEPEGDAFSNDGSLLLPAAAAGQRYVVLTREQSFERLPGFVTVVSTQDAATDVAITVTAPTAAGAPDIPALAPGERYETRLGPYEVLSLASDGPGADLTGTRIEASAPVAVFGGSQAAAAPDTNHCLRPEGVCEYDRQTPCGDNYDCTAAGLNTCCADHLEHQLLPDHVLGRRYVAAKSFDRGEAPDLWRVVAIEDDTHVETVPPQGAHPVLNEGDWFEIESRAHFELLSDKPVAVGQFLASAHAPDPNLRGREEPGDAGIGDPAFIVGVPVDRFLPEHAFAVPPLYRADYVTVVAPAGAAVRLDDAPLPVAAEPLGGTWSVYRVAVADGFHRVTADTPVGVYVYGFEEFVSYGFVAGLDLSD